MYSFIFYSGIFSRTHLLHTIQAQLDTFLYPKCHTYSMGKRVINFLSHDRRC